MCEHFLRNGIISTDSSEPLVQIRGLSFSRGSRVIFDGIDMDIRQGQVTAIMGPSGTGKTTLLKLIGGQLKPDAGTVHVAGENIHKLSMKALYDLRRRTMGMLFQSGALLTDMSVFENVAFPLREHTRLPESAIQRLVMLKLEVVGLRGARDLMPAELSGGMARRVALARAIALDPQIIMYDEPFTGQDPISMGVIVKLIHDMNHALGMTSVVVSHDVGETASISDYIYVVSGGQVVEHGTPKSIRHSSSEWVQQFMGGLADGPVPFHYSNTPLMDDLMPQGKRGEA